MRKGKWLTAAEVDLVVRALWIASHCDTETKEEHAEALQFEKLRERLIRGAKREAAR